MTSQQEYGICRGPSTLDLMVSLFYLPPLATGGRALASPVVVFYIEKPPSDVLKPIKVEITAAKAEDKGLGNYKFEGHLAEDPSHKVKCSYSSTHRQGKIWM